MNKISLSATGRRIPKFQNLYKDNYDRVLNFIKARVATTEDAEDIAADVFMRVYKNLNNFKWQGVAVESWVFRIARNAIIDYHRRRDKYKNDVQLEEISYKITDDEKDLLVNLIDGEEEVKLYQAIAKLAEDDQYLIYYRYFEELSIKEISEKLGQSETNTGTRLHRIRKKLLKLVNDHDKNSKKHSALASSKGSSKKIQKSS